MSCSPANTYCRKVVWLGYLILFPILIHASQKFQIKENLEPTSLTPFVSVYHNIQDLGPLDVLKALEEGLGKESVSSTSFGFSHEFYYLKVDIENTTNKNRNEVISINNPHLDFVKVWSIDRYGEIELVYLGGDGMPFYDRTVVNRNVVIPIPLNKNETKTYIFQVDKRGASVSVPIRILSLNQFNELENESLLAFGMYFGVLALIIVFSLFVYSIIKQPIFFWYAFYLAFLGLYLLAHIGIFFQIGYPNQNWFNDYSRPIFITFSTTALLHFIRLLLNIEYFFPLWNKAYNVVIFILGIITVYWLVTPWWHAQQTIIYLNIQNLTLLLSLLLVLVTSILTFRKQKVIVAFFWIAFLAVLSAGISIILVESGIVSERVMAINPLFFGSMIEAIVFAIGLSYWSKVNDRERIQLVEMIQISRKKMVNSYVQGVEVQKEKIATELHDDIGSRLGHLKRQLVNQEKLDNSVIQKIEKISSKVRRISHELSPPKFKSDEFLISLRHLVYTHQSDEMEINLQVFDIPNNLEKEVTKQIYRLVQSGLNNIERHAKASYVDVQLFFHKKEIVLAMEDNGIGFNYNQNNPGATMKSMLSRVELLEGNMEVSSSKRHGTSIMINVPISNDQLGEQLR